MLASIAPIEFTQSHMWLPYLEWPIVSTPASTLPRPLLPDPTGYYNRSPPFCANAGMKSAPSPGGRSGWAPSDGCIMPCSTPPTSQVVARETLQSDVITSQRHCSRT
jgi:hypothetical protein